METLVLREERPSFNYLNDFGGFWKPGKVGDKEKGEVVKGYRIKKPKDDQQTPPSQRNPGTEIQRAMESAYHARHSERPRRGSEDIESEDAQPTNNQLLLVKLLEAYQEATDVEPQRILLHRIKKLSKYISNPDDPYCQCG